MSVIHDSFGRSRRNERRTRSSVGRLGDGVEEVGVWAVVGEEVDVGVEGVGGGEVAAGLGGEGEVVAGWAAGAAPEGLRELGGEGDGAEAVVGFGGVEA